MRMASSSVQAHCQGDGWRDQHDTLKGRVHDDIRDMGLPVSSEVYGIFAPLLPQVAKDELGAQPARKRQGMVPDLMAMRRQTTEVPVQRIHFELKMLHYAPSTYPAVAERCHAVARRASSAYARHVRWARSGWATTREN